jgi:hypothetical protein
MENHTHTRDFDQLKLNLAVLKNKISLAQEFLNQVQEEAHNLQEAIFDEEDRAMEKIQLYVNQL